MSAIYGINRRAFLGTAAAAAAATLVPRSVRAGARPVPADRPVRIGYVGCGTQGFRQLMPALEHPDVRIVAVCDPMRRSDDYPDYGDDELNKKVRKFLNDPQWAAGARGALCGREPGQEIVRRHYAARAGAGAAGECRAYADVREMLEREKDLDAVYIMTPDHLHAVIAVRAMRRGLHVITHKPISNVLNEVRVARDVARETGAATQLFCAAGSAAGPTLRERIEGGAIGPVREVYNWSTRPFWPQGMTEPPPGTPPVPEGFDWDLWVGPAAARPYHPAWAHTVFRGWIDFGSGSLGDMGHYSFHQIFEALQLGSPLTVEAARSEYWKIDGYQWKKQPNSIAYPQASMIRWEFPARRDLPPVALHWYDGGLRPPMPPELDADAADMPAEGILFVGERGKLLADFMGDHPRLIPRARMREAAPPAQKWPRPASELDQFVRACRGGPPSDASFENAYPYAETILLGNIALRVGRKLKWNSERAEFTNSEEANRLRSRVNRAGWEI